MPVPKKRTTSTSEATTVESLDHTMPDAQEFRHHLRSLAVSAMRSVLREASTQQTISLSPASKKYLAHSVSYPNDTFLDWVCHTVNRRPS